MAQLAVMDNVRLPVTPNVINREHRLARQSADTAIEHAIRCGELLNIEKSRTPHGQFMSWVEENLVFSHRQANKYMKLANSPSGAILDFNSINEALGYDKKDTYHAKSSSTDRMRLYRYRKELGVWPILVDVGDDLLRELVRQGLVSQKEMDDEANRARAIGDLLDKMVGF